MIDYLSIYLSGYVSIYPSIYLPINMPSVRTWTFISTPRLWRAFGLKIWTNSPGESSIFNPQPQILLTINPILLSMESGRLNNLFVSSLLERRTLSKTHAALPFHIPPGSSEHRHHIYIQYKIVEFINLGTVPWLDPSASQQIDPCRPRWSVTAIRLQ